jgi:hypothetical protein
VQTEIERRVPELVHEYARQLAADRRNELETYLKYAMRAIANRIDRGFGFEARAAALPVESEATEDEAPGRQSEERTHIDAVQSVQSDLRYLRPDGPPILSLPESDGQTQDASASQAGEPKPKESKGRKPQ